MALEMLMMLIDVPVLTVGYPLHSPSPRALIVDKKTGDCSHAPLQLPRLSVSRRYHSTPALANCCFVRGYLPMCVLLLSWI